MHAGVHTEAGKMFRVSKEVFGVFVFLRCLVGWLCFSPVTSRVSPRRATYFFCFAKKSKQKKASHVRALRVPCATRSVRGTCKLASLELSTPLNRLRRFPLQGTTPAARQSRLRGVPGRGCASLASPRLLVRFAHLAGVGVASFLYPHCSQGHGTPCHYAPHPSILALGQPQGLPLRPHSYDLTPTTSPLTHSQPAAS